MLDPEDVSAFREQAHRMLDDTIDAIAEIRGKPVWQPVPSEVRHELMYKPLPWSGIPLYDVYADFQRLIAPYATGNRHPRFFGWVHGNGTPSGMVAEMLAAGLNCNVGGREHAAVYVERAVIAWWAEIFGFPSTSSGIVTSGTSLATLISVLIARTHALGVSVRTAGTGVHRLRAYAAEHVHHCVPKAFEITGLGSDALRRIPSDAIGALSIDALRRAIAADKAAGFEPFLVVGTAGSVDTGAFDDLASLAAIAKEEKLWFHVDGAFGAMAILVPHMRTKLAGLAEADSLATDFHKWLHVPYGAGLVLTRHRDLHSATFADDVNYLARATSGTAGGEPWFCDFGPELSRRFRALAVWMTMREFGLDRLGAAIAEDCRLAVALADRIGCVKDVVLAAPVHLNIVCARYAPPGYAAEEYDRLNAALAVKLQEGGLVVPSTTRLDGRLCLRFNFTNHRVRDVDLDIVIAAVLEAISGLATGARSAKS